MVGIRTAQYSSDSVSVAAQEIPLLSIDYAQGETDLNFVFFYAAPRGRRRLPISCVKGSLLRAAQQFPVLLGHIVRGSDGNGDDGDGDNSEDGWKIVIDPGEINWPLVTESRAKGCTVAALRRSGFDWKQWPTETQAPDLRTHASKPLLGVHIVRYACGGVSLHTKVRHQCMDGNGVWRFYHTWSSICFAELRRYAVPPLAQSGPTVASRLVLSSKLATPLSESDAAAIKYMDGVAQFLEEAAGIQRYSRAAEADGFRVHRFSLSQASIERLKLRHGKLAACSSAHMGFVNQHGISYVSTNDLVCALFWRAIARAHQRLYPEDPHACMMLACDIRNRIGVQSAYGGNASFPLIMHMAKAQLAQQTITDTATHIRRHVGLLCAGFVKRVLQFMASAESMEKLISMFHPSKAFFSASIISKFPMFNMTNFGFGRPVHIDIPAYLTPGFSIWMPTRSSAQPVFVNLALTTGVFALVRDDPEFRQFVDIAH
ncbi:hypothetical protein IWW55_004738 [Coemansia sp. RSA 2706]|nr:hypothetical protein IWW55_004738 [Coemansia sp. RSA 2706]KAJ2313368.1 hypothetical protein IWW52_004586 [Coemansia sp. RSA 2704]